jgi:N-acetylneuraminate synthase
MEFTEEQWVGLQRHAQERGLKFLSSPFSIEAVELLTRVGVAAWKVASGEVSNIPMLERMLATGLPFIVSTGMSPLSEIDAVVQRIMERRSWNGKELLPYYNAHQFIPAHRRRWV